MTPHNHSQPSNVQLLPMDYALLAYLVEHEGEAPTIAIPAKLFNGEIPDDAPNLVESGIIVHIGDRTVITDAGRAALSDHRSVKS